jgi:hypothetical protein
MDRDPFEHGDPAVAVLELRPGVTVEMLEAGAPQGSEVQAMIRSRARCPFCFGGRGRMCRRCAKAYDRWLASSRNDGTTFAVLLWAARRGRRFGR